MSFTFALKRCSVCGKLKLMPPKRKRCYDCQLLDKRAKV